MFTPAISVIPCNIGPALMVQLLHRLLYNIDVF